MFSIKEQTKIKKFALKSKKLSFGKIFSKQRTFLDVNTQNINNFIEPDSKIKNLLTDNDYTIIDYTKGLAVKNSDSNKKNVYKIGKLLRKLDREDLIKSFEQRTHGTMLKDVDKYSYKIIISHNAFDIAGMSTDKNWTSCTDIREGCRKDTPFNSIKYGNMVAYLVKEEDIKDINKALARIVIKRFYQEKKKNKFVFLAEKRIYGDSELAERVKMVEIVERKLDEHNNNYLKFGVKYLRADKDDYSDSFSSFFEYMSTIDMIKKCINNRYNWPKYSKDGEENKQVIVNEDGSVTINSDFTVSAFYEYYSPLIKYGKFTVKFREIDGDFTISSSGLQSLEGCPDIIKGNFSCSWNNIFTLEGCPKKVKGNFFLTNNVRKFSKQEIRKYCDVKRSIYTDK